MIDFHPISQHIHYVTSDLTTTPETTMSDESEESCLVSSKQQHHHHHNAASPHVQIDDDSSGFASSARFVAGTNAGGSAMPYTDGVPVQQQQQQQTPSNVHSPVAAPSACIYARLSDSVVVSQTAPLRSFRGDAANGGRGSQQSQVSESGELIEFNDEILLSQFHADALKQVCVDGFGWRGKGTIFLAT